MQDSSCEHGRFVGCRDSIRRFGGRRRVREDVLGRECRGCCEREDREEGEGKMHLACSCWISSLQGDQELSEVLDGGGEKND